MRILLIGGTGFIGRFVIAQLHEQGHTLAVVSRGTTPTTLPQGVQHLRAHRADLAPVQADLRAVAPEVVVDLIASSGTQAKSLMDTFRGLARRVVVLSSMDVYRAAAVLHRLDPGPPEPLPLTESSPLRNATQTYPPEQIRALQAVFGWLDDAYDKVAVEAAVLADPTLPATVLRLPMVYGPGDPLHRLFPLLKRMADGRPAILFEERMAAWRAPRGYVENVAAAIVAAVGSEITPGRIYNLGEPDSLSELDWAKQVAESAAWQGRWVILRSEDCPAHLRNPANLEQHWVADTSRFRRELGFEDPFSRTEALRRTVEWERASPPAQWDPALFDYPAEDAALG